MDLKELITNNQNLIYKLTHYFKNYENKEDLFQVGCIGLINAYKKYDPNFNVKFTTYAFPYILGEMRKYVREDKGIKISKEISKLNLQIEKATILLTQKLMREPTLNEISIFLNIPYNELNEAINSINKIVNLDSSINDDKLTLYDVIKDKELDIDSILSLKDALSELNEFERNLIVNRYYNDLTQSETAKLLGISQVQVSRNEQKVLTKLRSKIAS